jgi:hypothetical protein
MKGTLLLSFIVLSLQMNAQSEFDKSIDKENGSVVYKGQVRFGDLKKEPNFSWFESGAQAYKPDTNAIKFLKKHLPGYNLVVLMGTWCDDSQVLIPKLYKTLQLTEYPLPQLELVGVDRSKRAKYIEHTLYRLEKVPTIILFKEELETGRIVEVVKESVETDLMRLIEADLKQKQ